MEVTQSDWQEEEICRIVVQDTGVGISPEFLPQLFTPYARENRFGTQTVIGTGLGMAIVKTIVTRMKGQIQVESTPDVGTTFTLTIPMSRCRSSRSRLRRNRKSAARLRCWAASVSFLPRTMR